MTLVATDTEKKETVNLTIKREVSQCSFNTQNGLLIWPIGVQRTVAEPNESPFKFVSIVIIMGERVLARMGSRWQTYSLQEEGVRSLNQCVNGREFGESADEWCTLRRKVKHFYQG